MTLSDVDGDEQDDAVDPETVYVYVNEYGRDSDEDEDEDQEAVAALLALGVIIAQAAAPHLKRWWQEQALPFLKSRRNKLFWTRGNVTQGDAVTSLAVADSPPANSSHEALLALEEYKATMTSAEARERLAAALAARIFFEEQIQVLRNARIEDDNGSHELVSGMEMLTPQQLADGIVLMLEANPSLLDQEVSAALLKILGSDRIDAEHRPSRNLQTAGELRFRLSKEQPH